MAVYDIISNVPAKHATPIKSGWHVSLHLRKKNGNGIQFPGISYAVCSDRCCKVAVRKFFGVILLAVVEIVKVED